MTKTLRQSMSWMHTWVSLLFGWILYFMFVTGAVAYYDTEIDRWMTPERPAPVVVSNVDEMFQLGVDHASEVAPDADRYFIRLPTTRTYSQYIDISWSGTDADGNRFGGRHELLADGTVAPAGRDTGGGQALYRLHWTFHYFMDQDLGVVLAGVAGVFMFAAIITGIVIHKKIIADFFTLRLNKGQRSWLDSHNVLSVMSLPYQIMITYSGVVFSMVVYFPMIIASQYGTGPDAVRIFEDELRGDRIVVDRAGIAAPLPPIAPFVEKSRTVLADQLYDGEKITRLEILNPGDASARITFHGALAGGVQRATPFASFDAATGELLFIKEREWMTARATNDVLEGLHEGLFAGPVLRAFMFVSALMGGGMVATGMVLWVKKRRQKLRKGEIATRGLVLTERLNVGVIAGLPIAIAIYFLANRLLPLEITARADWEMHAMFIAWGAALFHSALRPSRKAWTEQLYGAAALFAAIPVVNALSSSAHLANTLPLFGQAGDWGLAGVDLWILVLGFTLGYAGWLSSRTPAEKPRKRSPAPRKSGSGDEAITPAE